MKKFYILSFFVFISVYVGAQDQKFPPVTSEKISDNLYMLVGGDGANSGMYIGDNEVLLIDSKRGKSSVDGILAAVKSVTDKPITFLVNTHSDGDHVSGNQFMPDGITIVSQENCRKEFYHTNRDGSPSMWLAEELQKYIPKITFNDRMQIHLGSKVVELYYFGVGHTTGDAVVYFPEEKTAFIGDQVFWGRPQLIHSYKGGNSFEHVKTLKKMLATLTDAEKFCSGHADIKTRADVEQHIVEFTAFQQKVKDMITEGKSLKDIQAAFAENEAQLVESVYNEIKEM